MLVSRVAHGLVLRVEALAEDMIRGALCLRSCAHEQRLVATEALEPRLNVCRAILDRGAVDRAVSRQECARASVLRGDRVEAKLADQERATVPTQRRQDFEKLHVDRLVDLPAHAE